MVLRTWIQQPDRHSSTGHALALALGLRKAVLTVVATLPATLNGHVDSTNIGLEFEVDGSLSSREDDRLNLLTL